MARIALIKAGHAAVRQHFNPPLGIMSLASFLRDRVKGVELKLIDMLPEGLSAKDAVERALTFQPDVLGISAMSYEAGELALLAAASKAREPGLIVVAGGPHAATASGRVMEDPNIDYIVRGEGELTFLEMLPRLLAGDDDMGGVKGIGFRRNGAVVMTPARDQTADMDSLSLPAYDLIDLSRYWDLPRFGTTFVHREYATLSTSRACPYNCTYCHRIFGNRYRAQSPEIVLRDLESLRREHGVKEILFVDDCFNLDRKRVAAICDGIVERGLKFSISFPNGIRGDLIEDETLEKLKAAGAYRITYAIETASPRIQKLVKKNVKLDKLKRVIEKTDALDVMVDGFFMVGFPGETRDEVRMTLDYALDSRLHSANFWFVTPFKGTELYEQAVAMGYKVPEQAEGMHYFDPGTDLSEVSAPELKKMVRRTFLRFYLNPWRAWRIFKLFPNQRQIPALFLRFLRFSLKWS
ncbi:MAG TPA: radical SAM protein [bacterium]|nr:radical SAM protein [bacterium]